MSDAHDVAAPRLFLAVALDEEARRLVHLGSAPLRAAIPRGVAWVPPEKLHVTLRFLGPQPAAVPTALIARLADVARDVPAHEMRVAELGAFPSRTEPRVLWVGVEMNVALAALYQKVDDLCASLGLGREGRPFRPHVTLGRVRAGPAVDAARRVIADLPNMNPVSSRVRTLDLMASTLAPDGSRHSCLAAAPLGAPGSR